MRWSSLKIPFGSSGVDGAAEGLPVTWGAGVLREGEPSPWAVWTVHAARRLTSEIESHPMRAGPRRGDIGPARVAGARSRRDAAARDDAPHLGNRLTNIETPRAAYRFRRMAGAAVWSWRGTNAGISPTFPTCDECRAVLGGLRSASAYVLAADGPMCHRPSPTFARASDRRLRGAPGPEPIHALVRVNGACVRLDELDACLNSPERG